MLKEWSKFDCHEESRNNAWTSLTLAQNYYLDVYIRPHSFVARGPCKLGEFENFLEKQTSPRRNLPGNSFARGTGIKRPELQRCRLKMEGKKNTCGSWRSAGTGGVILQRERAFSFLHVFPKVPIVTRDFSAGKTAAKRSWAKTWHDNDALIKRNPDIAWL